MSGPFGVNMVLISGRRDASEIVVAAAAFLSMGWLSITPVSTSKEIREEFVLALDVFGRREGVGFDTRPDKIIKEMIEPNNKISLKHFFWLALDAEGNAIARNIFADNGEDADQRVYKAVNKVNLIESHISPPPSESGVSTFWEQISSQLFKISMKRRQMPSSAAYRSLMYEQIPMSSIEQAYHAWFESLYYAILPWKMTIRDIQSDLS